MIHISSAGCGWKVTATGYTCSGLPKLDIAFSTTSLTGRVVDNEPIDHYDYIPQHIEGFLMTLSPIIDMSGTTSGDILEVPELACRVNFDPFVNNEVCVLNGTTTGLPINPKTLDTGFLNLYNQVDSYYENFYVTVSGATGHMQGDVFPTYSDTAIMGPGILEPMLNTQFGPIDIDTPPTPDLTTDAIIYSLVGLQGWRQAIDTRINTTIIASTGADTRNLENAKNMSGACYNFQIEVTGTTQVLGKTELAEPHYTFVGPLVDGVPLAGLVKIDGATHKVYNQQTSAVNPGIPAGDGFDAYLDIFNYVPDAASEDSPILGATIAIIDFGAAPESTTEDIYGTTISGFTHRKFEYIGSVKKIVSDADIPFDGGTAYKLYEIEQGDCLYEITLEGGTGGGGTCSCEGYEGPFRLDFDASRGFLVKGSLTDYEHTSGDTVIYHAGVIYACGASVSWPLEGSGYGSGDVYAHIQIDDGYSITYDNSQALYDRTQEPQIDPETGKPISPEPVDSYTIRLGYADLIEATTVDIPAGGTVYSVAVETLVEGLVVPENRPVGVAGSTIAHIVTVPDAIDDPLMPVKDIPTMIYVLVDGATPERPIAIENTVELKQYHTGDIYIDCQEIPEPPEPPEPTGSYEYNGPFKLAFEGSSGITVLGTSTDEDEDHVDKAGRIYQCGDFLAWANLPAAALQQGEIFAHIDRETNVITYNNSAEQPTSATADYYTVRLGSVTLTEASTVPIPVNGTTVMTAVSGITVGYEVVDPEAEETIVGTTVTAINPVAGTGDPSATPPVPSLIASLSVLIDGSTADTVPVTGATIDQYHTGDIYIDCQEIPEYDGPFKISITSDATPTAYTDTFETDSSTTPAAQYTGRVIYTNGASVTVANNVPVTSGIAISLDSYVYAHVRFKKSTASATRQTYDYVDTDINASASPTAPAPEGTTIAKTYTFRLARITGTAADSQKGTAAKVEGTLQIQYGDIYIGDVSDPVRQESDSKYDGPFKLDKSGSVSCSICPDEGEYPNAYSIAGYVSINGTGGAYAGSVRGKSVTLTGGTTNVFVNVTSGGASISTEQNTAPNCYSVWLGSITGATISDPAIVEAIEVTFAETTNTAIYHYVGRTSQVGSYAWDAVDGSSVYTAGDNAHTAVNSTVFDTSGSGATAIGTVSALIYRYQGGTQATQMHYGNIHVDGRWQ